MRPGIPYVLFAAQDVWAATADGKLAVVRSADYRVEWRDAAGRITSGRPVAFERRPVTFDDRMDHTRRFMQGTSISGKGADAGLSPLPAEMLEERRIREVAEYQEHAQLHAPFNAVNPHVAPDGSLWVERSVRLNSPQTWDVIGSDGNLGSRVQMPRGRRLMSLGAKWIYAVSTDEDGLQHLERYAYPK